MRLGHAPSREPQVGYEAEGEEARERELERIRQMRLVDLGEGPLDEAGEDQDRSPAEDEPDPVAGRVSQRLGPRSIPGRHQRPAEEQSRRTGEDGFEELRD